MSLLPLRDGGGGDSFLNGGTVSESVLQCPADDEWFNSVNSPTCSQSDNVHDITLGGCRVRFGKVYIFTTTYTFSYNTLLLCEKRSF